MHISHIVICGLSGCTIFFSQTAQFSGNKVPEQNVCFDFSTTFAWSISQLQMNWVRYGHNILVFMRSTYYFHILMKLEFSQQILEKYSNIKVNENPSIGGHCCSMETDMTKLTLLFAILQMHLIIWTLGHNIHCDSQWDTLHKRQHFKICTITGKETA